MRRALISAWFAAACGAPEGHPPVARITADPPSIPEHDGFQTQVVLDGTASADPLDPPGPLEYHWEITNDEARFEPGSTAADPAPTVTFLGDRPATIRLTVTDQDGQSATSRYQMTLTLE